MHEITSTDGLVLHKKAAWHGLGTIVQEAPTPQQALTLAGLDWQVEQEPVFFERNGDPILIPGQYVNVRSDTEEILGTVSDQYCIIQNQQLADFCSALGDVSDAVRIESAGSFRGGKQVFFLAKGESFTVGSDDDLVEPYCLISNGHDGQNGFSVLPTSVRVVCANTHRMAMMRSAGLPAYMAKHRGSVESHLEKALAVVQMFRTSMEASRTTYQELAARGLDSDTLTEFCLQCYRRDFPLRDAADEKTTKSHQERERKALASMVARFDQESAKYGANRWVMANAYTGWVQHRNSRSADRNYSRWVGTDMAKSVRAFDLAVTI